MMDVRVNGVHTPARARKRGQGVEQLDVGSGPMGAPEQRQPRVQVGKEEVSRWAQTGNMSDGVIDGRKLLSTVGQTTRSACFSGTTCGQNAATLATQERVSKQLLHSTKTRTRSGQPTSSPFR